MTDRSYVFALKESFQMRNGAVAQLEPIEHSVIASHCTEDMQRSVEGSESLDH